MRQSGKSGRESPIAGRRNWLSVNGSLYAVVVCALLPALSIILYTSLTLREHVLAEAKNRLENLTKSIASLQSEKTHQARTLGQTLAILPQVRSFDTPACTALFERVLRENEGLANIVLIDTSGSTKVSAAPSAGELDLSDRTSFKDAVRTKRFSAGDFLVSRIVKVPVMQFSTPVFSEDGDLAGVLLVTYDLGKYDQFFSHLALPPDSRLTLIDRNGVRLLALAKGAEPPPLGEQIVLKNWQSISQSEDESGSFIATRYDGKQVLFHFCKLRLRASDPPYMVALLNIHLPEIYTQANQTLRTSLALLAAAALLAMLIARMLGKTLVGQQVDALTESEQKFRTLFESMTEGVAVHEVVHDGEGKAVDYRILDVNPGFERLTGIDRSQAVGALASRVYGPQEPPYLEVYAAVASEGNPVGFETYFPPLGKYFRISAFSPGKGRFVAIFQDITQSKLLEDKLRRSESKLKATLNGLPAMICYWDKHLQNRFANHAYLSWFGIDADKMGGMHIKDIIGEVRFSHDLPYLEGVLAGAAQTFERSVPGTDGKATRFALVQYIPDTVDGVVQGFYSLITDITSVKQAEKALLASLQEKEILLKEIHHRVKNNLQIISSLLSLQERGVDNPEAQRILLDCQGRVMSMALVHDQLHRSSNLGGIDIGPYLGELLHRLAANHKADRDISLEMDIPSITLTLDQAIPFGLIVNELATNAFKHAFNGRKKGTVRVCASVRDENVSVTVEDDGCGLPQDFILCELTTLGLQIVTLLTSQLHGTLSVENCPGARFRIEFPLFRN